MNLSLYSTPCHNAVVTSTPPVRSGGHDIHSIVSITRSTYSHFSKSIAHLLSFPRPFDSTHRNRRRATLAQLAGKRSRRKYSSAPTGRRRANVYIHTHTKHEVLTQKLCTYCQSLRRSRTSRTCCTAYIKQDMANFNALFLFQRWTCGRGCGFLRRSSHVQRHYGLPFRTVLCEFMSRSGWWSVSTAF